MPTDLFGDESELPHGAIPGDKTLADLDRYLHQYDGGERSATDIEEVEFGRTRQNGKFIRDLWKKYLDADRFGESKIHRDLQELNDQNIKLKRAIKDIADIHATSNRWGTELASAIRSAKELL